MFGPTAIGKTELLPFLFQDTFEIINADSMQVYRHFNIGTAKPSIAIQKQIPFHLINFLSPLENFSVGNFLSLADEAAKQIISRGKIPVLCGGTAFYLKHFLFGLSSVPASDPAIRDAILKQYETEGIERILEKLEKIDKISHQKIHKNDKYRILRAYEVFLQTGRPFSSFAAPENSRSEYDFLLIGLFCEKNLLNERIRARVEAMFEAGLLEEFCALLANGYNEKTPAMKGIGYRECFEFVDGRLTLGQLKAMIILHTIQYAKRQRTFFKSLSHVFWFQPEQKNEIKKRIDSFLVL